MSFSADTFGLLCMKQRSFVRGEFRASDQVPEIVAKTFNNKHLHMMLQGVGIGLCGNIRAGHVKELLRRR